MGWQPNPYIAEGEAAAPLPGGRCPPPRCRASGPPGARAQIFRKTFCRKAPAARQRGGRVYSCKFQKQKYIFVKNKIEKYKNKKPRIQGASTHISPKYAEFTSTGQTKRFVNKAPPASPATRPPITPSQVVGWL